MERRTTPKENPEKKITEQGRTSMEMLKSIRTDCRDKERQLQLIRINM